MESGRVGAESRGSEVFRASVAEQAETVERLHDTNVIDLGEQTCEGHAQAFEHESGMYARTVQSGLALPAGVLDALGQLGALDHRRVLVRDRRQHVLPGLEKLDHVGV